MNGITKGSGNRAAGTPALTLLAVAALWAGAGCTAVGMLAGLGVDRATDHPDQPQPSSAVTQVTPGTNVCVETSTPGQEHLCGTYRGVTEIGQNPPVVHLLVDAGDHVAVIPTSRVQRLLVEEHGHAWLYGGAIGLAADVALLVAASQVKVNMAESEWAF